MTLSSLMGPGWGALDLRTVDFLKLLQPGVLRESTSLMGSVLEPNLSLAWLLCNIVAYVDVTCQCGFNSAGP